MKKLFLLVVCLTALGLFAQSTQDNAPPVRQGQGRGEGRGEGRGFRGQGVAGTITDLKPDAMVIKTMDGRTVTAKLSGDTQYRNGRDPAKLADFKVGDSVMVGGPKQNDDTVTANFVVNRTAAMAQFKEDLGKKVIMGEVKAIQDTKLTILRPDGETQTIEVDENTSFRKQRESITLADIKVGDHVMGRGELKDGVFVPATLNVGGPGQGGMMMMGPGPGGPPPKQ